METDLDPGEHHILLIEDQQDRVILLDAERYVIGRNDSNEIVLNRDPISREHAMLVRVPALDEERFFYRLIDGDTEGKPSTNGIFVNGKRQNSYDLVNDNVISFAGVVNALYIKTFMTEPQLAEFVEWISSSTPEFCYSDRLAGTQLVESYLSKNDPTSIMLGRSVVDSKGIVRAL
jgi:pSer/pThr/pTyr-binding forkhead associated (FHA) protein